MESGHLHPARLPPGTWVGPWRVLERRGWGAYGAVYRAFGVEDVLGPVALKVALHPGDGRFAREVELLSRLQHPCVPRFVDHGSWQQPGGLSHRYLAMEWVEGVPLYEWARELAEALEQAARNAGPEADAPLFAREESPFEAARSGPQHVSPREPRPTPWSWLVAAAGLGGAVALGAAWLLSAQPQEETTQVHASTSEEQKDAGTVAVGDTALTAPVPLSRAPSALSVIAVELPPKPLPGQTRPDAAGRCPRSSLIPIHGGCWTKVDVSLKDCDVNFNFYVYRGACYSPVFPPPRPNTSGSTESGENDAP